MTSLDRVVMYSRDPQTTIAQVPHGGEVAQEEQRTAEQVLKCRPVNSESRTTTKLTMTTRISNHICGVLARRRGRMRGRRGVRLVGRGEVVSGVITAVGRRVRRGGEVAESAWQQDGVPGAGIEDRWRCWLEVSIRCERA